MCIDKACKENILLREQIQHALEHPEYLGSSHHTPGIYSSEAAEPIHFDWVFVILKKSVK